MTLSMETRECLPFYIMHAICSPFRTAGIWVRQWGWGAKQGRRTQPKNETPPFKALNTRRTYCQDSNKYIVFEMNIQYVQIPTREPILCVHTDVRSLQTQAFVCNIQLAVLELCSCHFSNPLAVGRYIDTKESCFTIRVQLQATFGHLK